MRRLCLLGALFLSILLTACPGTRSTTKIPVPEPDSEDKGIVRTNNSDKVKPSVRTVTPRPENSDDYPDAKVTASLPDLTPDEKYESALLRAVDLIADRKYSDALEALKEAQTVKDTGAVQREIYKVENMISQQDGAEKAVSDVKTVLEDGKADEAARLATEALSQYGGGDQAQKLADLKQEADSLLTAATDDTANRKTRLREEAEAALKSQNLRAATVALEQAINLGEDPALSRQLAEIQDRLATYDDNRKRAMELRRDPTGLEEAITRLKAARAAWDTLQVQQDIEEVTLVLERRRDRLGILDFEVRGDVGFPGSGREFAEELLGHFKTRYDVVERGQIRKLLAELDLDGNEIEGGSAAGRELARLGKVRYVVLGSVSSLAGITVRARIVEVSTGLIVQTARISGPSVEALLPRMKQLALMLQMSDLQKANYEDQLQAKVEAIKPIEAPPSLAAYNIPEPPPPPPPAAPPPPPQIITYTPRPVAPLVITQFQTITLQPVVEVPPPPPPPLAVVIQREAPALGGRLFALSLNLGDDCLRRGAYQEANRHFSLALSIAGPRRELNLRIARCRPFIAPVVVAPPPVLLPASPTFPQPVFVPRPVPVVVVRPRVATFGFTLDCPPGLVPPASSEILADQFAAYCRGSYQVLDRGEVCWHMGRLGITMPDVLNNPMARRALAQSLNARFFVFGAVRHTASFDVETHLVDAETGAKTGTGKIHVQDQQELKLRLGELANQIGAKPEQQKQMAQQAAAGEKQLVEARSLLAKDPARAAEIARAGLKETPNNVALRSVLGEAERRTKLAAFEEARRKEAAAQARALEDARKRQQELAQEAARARVKAEADAKARGEAARKAQEAQKERAAASLRLQGKQALARGENARAVQLLESSAKLKGNDEVFRELAQARLASEKALATQRAAEQKKRADALATQRLNALARVQKEREAKEKLDAERNKTQEAHNQSAYDAFMKQAKTHLTARQYPQAVAAIESARRYKTTDESAKLLLDARHEASVATANDAQRKLLEAEHKKQALAEETLKKNRADYIAAYMKGQKAVQDKQYDVAVASYESAVKLFPTDIARNALKVAQDLRAREVADRKAAEAAKIEAARRSARLQSLITEGNKALASNRTDMALKAFREAKTIAPANVDVMAGLSKAERAHTMEQAQIERQQQAEARRQKIATALTLARNAQAKKQNAVALKAYRDVLSMDPDNKEAQANLKVLEGPPRPDPRMIKLEEDYKLALDAGRSARNAKNWPGAINAYKQALALKKDDPVALRELGEVQKMQVDATYLSYMTRGKTAFTQKKYAEAMSDFDSALKLKGGDAEAIKYKRAAADALEKSKMPPPPPPPDPKKLAYDRAMKAGATAMAGKNFAAASKAYDEALKQMPGDAEAIKFKRAAEEAIKKMTPTPLPTPPPDKNKLAYEAAMKAGQTAFMEKKFPEAARAFDEALQVKPGDAEAIKRKREAMAGMQPPTKPTPPKPPMPPTPPAKPPMSAREKQIEEDYKLAMDAGRSAMTKKNYPGAQNAYRQALLLKKNDPTALKELAEATRLGTETAYQGWMIKGLQAVKAKQLPEAVKAFDEALKLKPGDAEAIKYKKLASETPKPATPPPATPVSEYTKLMQRARALEVDKKFDDSEKVYRLAVKEALAAKQSQQLYAAWLGLARTQHAQMEFAAAVKSYEAALKLVPDSADAKAGLSRARANKP